MKMEFTTSILKHSEISEIDLSEICKLKALRWDYTFEQHKKWMTENIQPNDFHVMIWREQKLVAYTNLVDVTAWINNRSIKVRGIGNVCTSETGKGYGNILMEEVNEILKQKLWKGLLLCKDHLIPYYEKFDWRVIDKNVMEVHSFRDINFMVKNVENIIVSFHYSDRNF